MSAQRSGRPTRKVVSRDTLSFLGGWGLMVYEAIAAEPFNTTVFLGGMVIAGVPGALQAWALLSSARTPQESSDSPESPSSSASRT